MAQIRLVVIVISFIHIFPIVLKEEEKEKRRELKAKRKNVNHYREKTETGE